MLRAANARRNATEATKSTDVTANARRAATDEATKLTDVTATTCNLNGADVFMVKDQYNNYPLHYSTMENYPKILDFLLTLDNRFCER